MAGGKNKNAAAKGGDHHNAKAAKGSSKQQETEEFDSFLKDLQKATKETGGEKAKHTKMMTPQERKKHHEESKLQAFKAKEAEFEQRMEKQAQQKKLQALIQQMLQANRTFLDAPKTDFEHEVKKNKHFTAAVGAMQGWRANMEDAHVMDLDIGCEKSALFCVFDGHAGSKCSALSRTLMPALARKYLDPATGLCDFHAMYNELDVILKPKITDNSGSTAVSVIVTDKEVSCGSAGDSRAVLCRGNGEAISLSDDHKPENEKEQERILAAGGKVENNRVNGQLAMSRAIGDYTYKKDEERASHEQHVIPDPDTVTVPRVAGDRFLTVACDGIFDVMSNQELCDFISKELHEDPTVPLQVVCEKVCRHCLAPPAPGGGQPARPEGTDNMTIIITKF